MPMLARPPAPQAIRTYWELMNMAATPRGAMTLPKAEFDRTPGRARNNTKADPRMMQPQAIPPAQFADPKIQLQPEDLPSALPYGPAWRI